MGNKAVPYLTALMDPLKKLRDSDYDSVKKHYAEAGVCEDVRCMWGAKWYLDKYLRHWSDFDREGGVRTYEALYKIITRDCPAERRIKQYLESYVKTVFDKIFEIAGEREIAKWSGLPEELRDPLGEDTVMRLEKAYFVYHYEEHDVTCYVPMVESIKKEFISSKIDLTTAGKRNHDEFFASMAPVLTRGSYSEPYQIAILTFSNSRLPKGRFIEILYHYDSDHQMCSLVSEDEDDKVLLAESGKSLTEEEFNVPYAIACAEAGGVLSLALEHLKISQPTCA